MSAINRFAFSVLVLVGCAAVLVTSIPQQKKLASMKEELAQVQVKERQAEEQRDRCEREFRAMEEDPAYMELKARDSLNYYKPGEVIFRISRPEK